MPLPLARLVNRRRVLWAGTAFLLMVFCFGALLRAAPNRVRVGISNAFASGADGVAFEVLPGDTAVMPGSTVVLRARVSPAGVFKSVRLVRAGKERDARVLRLSADTCRISLAAGHGFEYRFRVLGRSSDPHRVRVLEPLGLERLAFTLHPPAYSGLPVTKSSGVEVNGLKGTVVDVEGEVNRLMSAGRILLDNDTLPVVINPHDSSGFTAEFIVKGDASGAIELADNEDKVLQPAVHKAKPGTVLRIMNCLMGLLSGILLMISFPRSARSGQAASGGPSGSAKGPFMISSEMMMPSRFSMFRNSICRFLRHC